MTWRQRVRDFFTIGGPPCYFDEQSREEGLRPLIAKETKVRLAVAGLILASTLSACGDLAPSMPSSTQPKGDVSR